MSNSKDKISLIKVKSNVATLSVYMHFSYKLAEAYPDLHPSFKEQALSIAEDWKIQGQVSNYELYWQELLESWKSYCQRISALAQPIRVTLLQGWPRLDGIKIRYDEKTKDFLIDIAEIPPDSEQHVPNWVSAYVCSQPEYKNMPCTISKPEIESALVNLLYFKKGPVRDLRISWHQPRLNPKRYGKLYTFIINEKKNRIELVIGDPNILSVNEKIDHLLDLGEFNLAKMAGEEWSSGKYYFDRQALKQTLTEVNNSVLALGRGLPLHLLIGCIETGDQQENFWNKELFIEDSGRVDTGKSLSVSNLAWYKPRPNIHISNYLKEAAAGLQSLPADKREVHALTLALHSSQWTDLEKIAQKFAYTAFSYKKPSTPLKQNHFKMGLEIFPLTRLNILEALPSSFSVDKGEFAQTPWLKLLLREMVGLVDFHDTPEWVSRKCFLPLSRSTIEASFKELLASGFLSVDPLTGRLSQTTKNIMTGLTVTSEHALNYHQAMLDLTDKALDYAPDAQSLFLFCALFAEVSKFQEIKEQFITLLKEIFELGNLPNKPDRIFQVNFQLLP